MGSIRGGTEATPFGLPTKKIKDFFILLVGPDEVATVWWLGKLICDLNVIYFVSAIKEFILIWIQTKVVTYSRTLSAFLPHKMTLFCKICIFSHSLPCACDTQLHRGLKCFTRHGDCTRFFLHGSPLGKLHENE